MVAAVVVIVGTGVLACAAVVRVALTAAVLIVAAIITLTVAAMAVVIIVIVVVVIIIVAIIAVVTIMVVAVITIVVVIVMIIVMITVVVVRACRLVVRCVIRLVMCGTVAIVVVVIVTMVIVTIVIVTVVIPYVSRTMLYPIRRGMVHVTRCVPEVMRRPRLVPNHRGGVAVGTHIERTPQDGCRSHRNHSARRRCDIHVVIVGGDSSPRTVKPFDSHLVGVVHIILHVIYVAAINLSVGGYRGNHRHYNE